MRVLTVTAPDINNGTGNRVTVWFAGCGHHCKGCQNEWTWKYDQGHDMQYAYDKLKTVLNKPYIDGVTFSGGDPLMQDDDSLCQLLDMIQWIREEYPGKTIWIYTGYTMEELQKSSRSVLNDILDSADVLVDGKYNEQLRNLSIAFRGSENQRILDLHTKTVINLDNKI